MAQSVKPLPLVQVMTLGSWDPGLERNPVLHQALSLVGSLFLPLPLPLPLPPLLLAPSLSQLKKNKILKKNFLSPNENSISKYHWFIMMD